MNENTKEKLGSYLELLGEIKEKTEDERTAVTLLQEISKDRRMDQIRQEKNVNGDLPATESQISYIKVLETVIPEEIDFENLTRKQASKLIEEGKKIQSELRKAIKKPVKIQEVTF